MKRALVPVLLCLLLLPGCFSPAPQPRTFPEPASLVPDTDLPDPLMAFDGVRVQSRSEWVRERRPELKQLFQYYMYGRIPQAPNRTVGRVKMRFPDYLGGKATLKIVQLQFGPETNAPQIDLMLVVPNSRLAPAPVFLAMNFCGNQALTTDWRVPLARGWVYDNCPGCTNNLATESSRGSQAENWPIEKIIDRGYALACFYSGDIDPDRREVSEGIYAWLAKNDPGRNGAADRGSIAAWAWGFHRCVDYLVRDGDIDSRHIAVVGHSRNGKTALLAAAFDERIAMTFAHQAGCGGSAPSRGKTGESVKAINDRFPHWFNGRFKQFNDATDWLPFDQHCLMALCAPRPLLVSAATDDQWSNPAGQFQMVVAATPVYRFVGAQGVQTQLLPEPGRIVGEQLAYYLREGRHSMTAADWEVFMKFADRHWRQEE